MEAFGPDVVIAMDEKGNLAVRIKGGDEHDEIGALSKAFNTMTARLGKRVGERTAELLNLQSYLSDIIDSMPSIIVGVDKEMIVGQWNLKAEQTTGTAHEINNPPAGILQNTQVLKIRMSKKLPKNIEVAQKLGLDPGMINQYMEDRGPGHGVYG